jgi:hypothetical protein
VPLSRAAMNTSFRKREAGNKFNSLDLAGIPDRSLTGRSSLFAEPVGQGRAVQARL